MYRAIAQFAELGVPAPRAEPAWRARPRSRPNTDTVAEREALQPPGSKRGLALKRTWGAHTPAIDVHAAL
jgi:hypothetical protein